MRPQHWQGETFKDKKDALFKYKQMWWQCISYWASVHFIRVTVEASTQVRVGRNEDGNLFPFLKLFFPGEWRLQVKPEKSLFESWCAYFQFFFSWDKLHWMLQNWINVVLSTICFLWLKILYLLIHESGKNRKAMHYGSACRSILNNNHF